MAQYATIDMSTCAPNGIEAELARLHFDIAGTAYAPAIAALKALVPTSRILFDHPYVPVGDTARGLDELGLSESDRLAIGRGNALRLLQQVRTAGTAS